MSLKGHTRKYRRILQEELLVLERMEEDQILPSDALERKTFIQKEMMRLLEEEELYWHKRSNLRWLLEGDNNSEFFHRMANGRKKRNVIVMIEDGDRTIEGNEELLAHPTNCYRNLFGPALWGEDEKVSAEENSVLIQPFFEDEIKFALFQMEKNKAAGPDKNTNRILPIMLGYH